MSHTLQGLQRLGSRVILVHTNRSISFQVTVHANDGSGVRRCTGSLLRGYKDIDGFIGSDRQSVVW